MDKIDKMPISGNCPGTLAPGYDTYSPLALKRVFNGRKVSHIMDFNMDNIAHSVLDENIGRLSISGVQEKLSAIVAGGRVILTNKDTPGKYILKPVPDNKRILYRYQMPANEHLTMQIAFQVFGIKTAGNALIFFNDGEAAYITQRFDIADDGSKIPQEDFASLARKTRDTHGVDFKYTGSYQDVANLIREYIPAWPVEMERFFRLVVFNYLFGNEDAHLKNFSVHRTADGDYILTPAYDLLNSSIHITDDRDFALDGGLFDKQHYSDTYERTGHPCQEDFRTFGELIGLNKKQTEKVITDFSMPDQAVYDLIDCSYLDDRTKLMYRRSYDERIRRFLRC